MNTYIKSKLIIEGLHNWPVASSHCGEKMKFLESLHRHLFNVTVTKTVQHNDRDIEFINFGRIVKEYITNKYFNNTLECVLFESMSCEQIATELVNEFDLYSCEVSEDDENSSLVIK
ncbi:MAG: hypothetical protein M0R17_09115 [Candidatus Omnitrophica bacterium]|jgi:hypothetical protein|nr:hypothetical protein [Candidatus Omnitrophota bacterium]